MQCTNHVQLMAPAACVTRTTFRHAQVVRTVHHIAPAGPACLNNNAPHRWGRPSPRARAQRMRPSAYSPSTEAIRP